MAKMRLEPVISQPTTPSADTLANLGGTGAAISQANLEASAVNAGYQGDLSDTAAMQDFLKSETASVYDRDYTGLYAEQQAIAQQKAQQAIDDAAAQQWAQQAPAEQAAVALAEAQAKANAEQKALADKAALSSQANLEASAQNAFYQGYLEDPAAIQSYLDSKELSVDDYTGLYAEQQAIEKAARDARQQAEVDQAFLVALANQQAAADAAEWEYNTNKARAETAAWEQRQKEIAETEAVNYTYAPSSQQQLLDQALKAGYQGDYDDTGGMNSFLDSAALAAANTTNTKPSADTLATLGNTGGLTLTNVDDNVNNTLATKPVDALTTSPVTGLANSNTPGVANPPATSSVNVNGGDTQRVVVKSVQEAMEYLKANPNTSEFMVNGFAMDAASVKVQAGWEAKNQTTSIPVFGSAKDAADYLKANPNTTSVVVDGFPMDAQSAIKLAQYQAAGNTGSTVDLLNQLIKDNAAKGTAAGTGTGTVVDTKPTTSIGALGTAPITTLSTSSIGALGTKPISTLDTKPISTLPTVGTQALTTADLATWGKTLPQGITADQLKTALEGQQTALTSQNTNFLKDWNTSADALKTDILTGVDTKNQAFGTQATQGFMDAFKNFQIPTNQQTGVNLGNYNDNRNAAADQWWSQYVTGRR